MDTAGIRKASTCDIGGVREGTNVKTNTSPVPSIMLNVPISCDRSRYFSAIDVFVDILVPDN